MVKIPGFDDLKKMGSGLIDQAKAVKFGEMVDKVKSGIDSVSGKKPPADISDQDLKNLFQGIFTTINELAQAQTIQLNAVKKIEKQLEELARIVETYEKPSISNITEPGIQPTKEDDKPHE